MLNTALTIALQDVDQSLIHRSDDFRQIMEQRELIERALGMQDEELHSLWNAAKILRTPTTGLLSEKRPPKRDPYVTVVVLREVVNSLCYLNREPPLALR